jgi:hypothetical protein
MHITLRRVKTDSPKEVTPIVSERFFPLISNVAGFIAIMASKSAKMVGLPSVCLKQPQARRNPTPLRRNSSRTTRTLRVW